MQPSQVDHKDSVGDEAKNPALNRVIERNLRKMIYLRLKAQRQRTWHERVADLFTSFSGRMLFVYLHVIWFGAWITLNSGLLGVQPFDPFPFGLLTMIVSLEAIFLSTFVLISQNRISQESERRSDLVMHISILTEHEPTLALRMLDALQDRLGVETESKDELADLESDIEPADVLAEIERLQQGIK